MTITAIARKFASLLPVLVLALMAINTATA